MKCRIGQEERCDKTGCEFHKVFNQHCKGWITSKFISPTLNEHILSKIENDSKKQKTFTLEKKSRKRPTGSTKTQSNKRQKIRKRRKIYDNHKGICYLCDKPVSFEEYTIEHVIPKSKGGTNKYVNLRPAHFDCNQKKGNKLLNEET